MKIVTTKKMVNGNTQTTVNLAPHETMMIVSNEAYYKLGAQMDDIVSGWALSETVPVYWDIHKQCWMDAR